VADILPKVTISHARISPTFGHIRIPQVRHPRAGLFWISTSGNGCLLHQRMPAYEVIEWRRRAIVDCWVLVGGQVGGAVAGVAVVGPPVAM
jgi:hypothetical protein